MRNGEKGIYTLITIVVLVITQAIIRAIGIDNISANVYITLLTIACIMVIYGTYKNKTKGLGVKYNIVVAILMIFASISNGIAIIILKCYNETFQKYSTGLVAISLISLFALLFYIIIGRIIYDRKLR